MNSQHGFVALITVILIASALSVHTITQQSISHFALTSIVQSEYREQSYYAAKSCLLHASNKVKTDRTYLGNETIHIGSYSCTIHPILYSETTAYVQTSATSHIILTSLSKTILLED